MPVLSSVLRSKIVRDFSIQLFHRLVGTEIGNILDDALQWKSYKISQKTEEDTNKNTEPNQWPGLIPFFTNNQNREGGSDVPFMSII